MNKGNRAFVPLGKSKSVFNNLLNNKTNKSKDLQTFNNLY